MKRKRAYLIRLVTWDDLDSLDNKQLSELAYKLNSVISVHHAEIFNEKFFVNEVWDKAGLNEIDIDVLFQDILHIPEEEVEHYIFPKEDVY